MPVPIPAPRWVSEDLQRGAKRDLPRLGTFAGLACAEATAIPAELLVLGVQALQGTTVRVDRDQGAILVPGIAERAFDRAALTPTIYVLPHTPLAANQSAGWERHPHVGTPKLPAPALQASLQPGCQTAAASALELGDQGQAIVSWVKWWKFVFRPQPVVRETGVRIVKHDQTLLGRARVLVTAQPTPFGAIH